MIFNCTCYVCVTLLYSLFSFTNMRFVLFLFVFFILFALCSFRLNCRYVRDDYRHPEFSAFCDYPTVAKRSWRGSFSQYFVHNADAFVMADAKLGYTERSRLSSRPTISLPLLDFHHSCNFVTTTYSDCSTLSFCFGKTFLAFNTTFGLLCVVVKRNLSLHYYLPSGQNFYLDALSMRAFSLPAHHSKFFNPLYITPTLKFILQDRDVMTVDFGEVFYYHYFYKFLNFYQRFSTLIYINCAKYSGIYHNVNVVAVSSVCYFTTTVFNTTVCAASPVTFCSTLNDAILPDSSVYFRVLDTYVNQSAPSPLPQSFHFPCVSPVVKVQGDFHQPMPIAFLPTVNAMPLKNDAKEKFLFVRPFLPHDMESLVNSFKAYPVTFTNESFFRNIAKFFTTSSTNVTFSSDVLRLFKDYLECPPCPTFNLTCPVLNFSLPACPDVTLRPSVCPNVTLRSNCSSLDFSSMPPLTFDKNSTVEIANLLMHHFFYLMTGDANHFIKPSLLKSSARVKRSIGSWLGGILATVIKPFLEGLVSIVSEFLTAALTFLLDFEPLLEKILQTLESQIESLITLILKFFVFIIDLIFKLFLAIDEKFFLFEFLLVFVVVYYFSRDLLFSLLFPFLLLFLFGLERFYSSPFSSVFSWVLHFRGWFVSLQHFPVFNLTFSNSTVFMGTINGTPVTFRRFNYSLHSFSVFLDDLYSNLSSFNVSDLNFSRTEF